MTLLSQLRGKLVVDVDSMDPDVASRHTNPLEHFYNMTSNQAIVFAEASRPDRAHLVKQALELVKVKDLDVGDDSQIVQEVVDNLTVLLAKDVYPYLQGRVLVQTSPSAAHDTEKTILHAKTLIAIFESNGIPKERVCIKIPTTPDAMIAAQSLNKIGIRTLGTCLFSLPQALAASQAGCLYISPYLNELKVHFEPTVWKKYKDTRNEHPMISTIQSIIHAYKEIGSKTLTMPASVITIDEVLALASLGPNNLTLPGTILDALASSTALDSDVFEPPIVREGSQEHANTNGDYLVDNASLLREAIQSDSETARKLADALHIFDEMENKTKKLVRELIKSGI